MPSFYPNGLIMKGHGQLCPNSLASPHILYNCHHKTNWRLYIVQLPLTLWIMFRLSPSFFLFSFDSIHLVYESHHEMIFPLFIGIHVHTHTQSHTFKYIFPNWIKTNTNAIYYLVRSKVGNLRTNIDEAKLYVDALEQILNWDYFNNANICMRRVWPKVETTQRYWPMKYDAGVCVFSSLYLLWHIEWSNVAQYRITLSNKTFVWGLEHVCNLPTHTHTHCIYVVDDIVLVILSFSSHSLFLSLVTL